MSSDLFAAFGEAPAASSHTPTTASNSNDPWDFTSTSDLLSLKLVPPSQATSGAPVSQNNVDDDDDFGDFEDASAATAPADLTKSAKNGATHRGAVSSHATSDASPFPPKAQTREAEPEQVIGQHPFAKHMDFLFSGGDDEYDAGDDDLEDLSKNPEAAMEYSKRMIAEQEAQAKKKPLPFSKPQGPAPLPAKSSNKLQKKSGYVPAKDRNVLFDAENVSEHDTDDDFGDFEAAPVVTSQPPSAPVVKATPTKLQKKSGPPLPKAQPTTPASMSKPRMPQIDLLGLGDAISVPNIMSPRSERANELLGHAKSDSMSRPKGSSLMPKQEEDLWDDFDTAEPMSAPSLVPSHSRNTSTAAVPTAPAASIASVMPTTKPIAQQNELPPTNIPPPLILLSRFTAIISSAQDALFHPLSKLESTQRTQLLAHPATHQFLITYLKAATVLAHIIAGRKLRWKRDQILAASMRIGPSGSKGGMKLTSIDKSEVGKEDREVLDIVHKWKAQVGKVRSAVTSASVKLGNVPDVVGAMPVRTLKATEGGFTAPHACALCGLKREERVVKVDVDVNDSFGEWWIEGMNMHLVCKEWWDENKSELKGR